jgi:uncharacterized repeat protein (TIGR01451 family)
MILARNHTTFTGQKGPSGQEGARNRGMLVAALWVLLLTAIPAAASAQMIQNAATGSLSAAPLIVTNATVTLTRAGGAVSSVVSEINPHTATVNATGALFTYDLFPTINAGYTGVDRLTVTAPAGYSALSVTALSVGGVAQTANCPTPGAGQHCATTAGQVMTVTLGTRVTASGVIRITFSATTPGVAGSADFTAAVDDSATAAVPAQTAIPGDANGNNADGNNQTVTVANSTIASDLHSTVTATPQIVVADGVAATSIITVLRDTLNSPVPGKTITIASDRGVDLVTQPTASTDAAGAASGAIRSATVGISTITATDVTDGITLSARAVVFFTQGQVLEITKNVNRNTAAVGDVLTYMIEIRNKTANIVTPVLLHDRIPPNFKYRKGSARLNGTAVTDPAGNRPLVFNIGSAPALVDTNGNGRADPGEQGYMVLTYQLIVGSGATPREYVNTAAAKDVCDQCFISNASEAKVTVTLDPLFDLGTIIGKVFNDKNGNGWQDRNEPGVASAMVVLDNGDYVVTDEFGRFHFPAVKPGHRLVKINLLSLAAGSEATTDETVVVTVTPGLLAKANFGVVTRHDTEMIGRPARTGIGVKSESRKGPVQIAGNVQSLDVVINGTMASLPRSDIRMSTTGLYEIVELNNGQLAKPVEFTVALEQPGSVADWKLALFDGSGAVIRTIGAAGPIPPTIAWDGRSEKNELVKGGELYQYQMDVRYADGSRSTSARRIFGVNQTTAISLNLTGSAFKTGSSELSPDAESMLKKIGEILRGYPEEKVIIEGHTDSVGSVESNVELSKQRVESAITYLVTVEHIPAERFVRKWYGMSRPIADNATPEGRALNRRVEIKGEAKDIEKAKLLDEYRTEPSVRINGSPVRVSDDGRFSTNIEGERTDRLRVEVVNAQGGSVKSDFPIPLLEVLEPRGEFVVPSVLETQLPQSTASASPEGSKDSEDPMLEQPLVGKTAQGNTVELDGKKLALEPDGTFRGVLKLRQGKNLFDLVVRNPQGLMRVATLSVTVSDRDEKGNIIIVVRRIPKLTVEFPPRNAQPKDRTITVAGLTDAENKVDINGEPVPVQSDGRFTAPVKLPMGKSRIVARVVDPDGYTGTITREITVSDTQLFFLAFGDGVVGQMRGKGYLDGAGMSKSSEYYTEGRAAYYLKGTIAGKYLITSAFDTGTNEFNKMFKNLDATENDRLLTNLDPDKIYPVYGDSSTLVHDAQSQGKFYLAVDSEEMRFLVGNYPLTLTDVELAAYQRTLYGARASYQSLSRSRYGAPDTQVVVFGAEAVQAHVQDEVRATGGSLYYLSHHDIIEGSERVALLVRDKNTGLPVSRIVQQQNVDYTVKYPEGRILFNRPISSFANDSVLINQGVQSGNPVFIQVDYESRVESFEKTADGGRVRQQAGDHVAVGATYVKDHLQAAEYELQGVDTEVRFGKNTRIIGEYAKTSGANGTTFVSADGGLTYTETTPTGMQDGKAWKAAAELDIGELFGAPDLVQAGGYVKKIENGFFANGTSSERGTRKSGANVKLQVTPEDKILARYDRDETEATSALGAGQTDRSTVQYTHDRKWWSFTGEYQSFRSEVTGTNPLQDTNSSAAARLQVLPTDKLTLSLTRQETVSGAENDQTGLGVKYQILPRLALDAGTVKGAQGQSTQGGLVYSTDDKRIYLTERLTDDRSGRFTSTVLGSDYRFAPSSKVYSEYQWEHSDGDAHDRSVELVGLQRQWDAVKGFSFLLSGEQSRIRSKPDDRDRYALAGGISYLDPAGFKASSRYEVRYERGASKTAQHLTVSRAEYKLNPDFTALGSYRYSMTRNLSLDRTDAQFDERVLGLAYRPVAHDWFNALAKYTRLLDQRPDVTGATTLSESVTNVTSIEWSLQCTRNLEWVEKAALKVRHEESNTELAYTTHTYLLINRLNYTIWRQIDIGAEYRILTQKEARDQRQGWLAEVLWKPVKYLRVGGGYNFTSFSDNEFSNNNYSVRGWFIRMQGKY